MGVANHLTSISVYLARPGDPRSRYLHVMIRHDDDGLTNKLDLLRGSSEVAQTPPEIDGLFPKVSHSPSRISDLLITNSIKLLPFGVFQYFLVTRRSLTPSSFPSFFSRYAYYHYAFTNCLHIDLKGLKEPWAYH